MAMRITRLHRLCALGVVVVLLFNLVGCAGSGLEGGKASRRASTEAASTAASAYLGDIDGDGSPSVADAIAILRIVVGLDAARHLADCDQDGSAGVADAIAVLRCVVGLTAWPIGQFQGIGLELPANGPSPDEIEVVIGGQSVAQPDAGGTVPDAPSDDATCTVFALDTTSGDAMLLAVVPPAAATAQDAGGPTLSPASTVAALLFFRLGGWLVPQEKQAELLGLFDGLPEVQAFIAAFHTAYEADGHALRSMETDAALQAAFQAAVDAASAALDASTIAEDIRNALGIAASESATVWSQAWGANPTSAEGVNLSFSGDTVTATNNTAIYRWAEITDSQDQRLGWCILPARDWPFAAPQTVLQPNPLPALPEARTPLMAVLNGGLLGDTEPQNVEELVPVGLTLTMRVTLPLISCIVGVQRVGRVETIGDLFGSGSYHTGHPLVDWLMANMVWDPADPAGSADNPVPALIQSLLLATASGRVDVIDILSAWTWQTLLPAIASSIPSLAAAIVAEFGGAAALSVVLQALGILSVPWLVAIIKGAMIASALITIAPTLWDLCAVQWRAYLRLTDDGGDGDDEPFDETTGPDGQTLVWVPGGSFRMGSAEGEANAQPVHRVILDDFWIGRWEITNTQYAAFLNAAQPADPYQWIYVGDYDCGVEQVGGVYRARAEEGQWPVAMVSWDGAVAYCAHYGYVLPTEAQWEYAAAGPDANSYPWGGEWDAQKCCNRSYSAGSPFSFPAPVGSFPAGESWCGAQDMAGSVWEWCADWFALDYYANSPVLNPPGADTGQQRVVRGGSYVESYSNMFRCAYRDPTYGFDWDSHRGFRCARAD